MPSLFRRSRREDHAADVGSSAAGAAEPPDFDALLQHFSEMPLAQRTAEVLAGIASELPRGEQSAVDRLFAPWLAEQYTAEDRPDSWYALKYVLAEAFQGLELGRMLFRIDETPGGDMMSYYAISADGAAALKRAGVAVLERRLPD